MHINDVFFLPCLAGFDPRYEYEVSVRALTQAGFDSDTTRNWVKFRTQGPSGFAGKHKYVFE